VVDDHLMKISHVLRAQEWIPSTPLHVIMYKAFGWEHPEYCHLPMVMGQDGKKLSKRHGATSVDEFRRQGYLPEALLNYVALLGASYEEGSDLFTLDQLAKLFKLDKLNKAPAVFDYVKLEWFNGQYIRMLSDAELVERITPYMVDASLVWSPPNEQEAAVLLAAAPLVKERLKYLSDAPEALRFLFLAPDVPPVPELIPKKLDAARTAVALSAARDLLSTVDLADHDSTEAAYRAKAAELGLKLGDLLLPLRVAVTGTKVSPPLFQSIAVLGTAKAIARADKAIAALEAVV